jgi:hypothetical protein
MKDRLELSVRIRDKAIFTILRLQRVNYFVGTCFAGHQSRFCDAFERDVNAFTRRVYSRAAEREFNSS